MNKFIISILLMSCGLFESLLGSSSWDQAIQYQHEDAGFDGQDFDHDDENREEFVESDTDLDSHLQEKYSSWENLLNDSIRLHHNESGFDSDDVNDESSAFPSDSASDKGGVMEGSIGPKGQSSWLDLIKSLFTSKADDVVDDLMSIEGLAFSQLTSDEQRVAYLKNSFKDDIVSKDVNYLVISHFLVGFSDYDYAAFVEKVRKFARAHESNVITMKDVDKAVYLSCVDKSNKALGKSLHINRYLYDLLSFVVERSVKLKNWVYPHEKKSTTYHEASHALLSILKLFDHSAVSFLSVEPRGFLDGAITNVALNKNFSDSAMSKSLNHDARLAHARYKIMMYLAGGIGEQIFNGEKLSFKEFINSNQYHIGRRYLVGTDLDFAYKEAEYYYVNKKINMVFDVDRPVYYGELIDEMYPSITIYTEAEIALFLEDCYEETYAFLIAHKDMLDAIVAKIEQEGGFISGSEMYKIAGKARPKYYFELTSQEKIQQAVIDWISWTHKRMAFFEENHPQV